MNEPRTKAGKRLLELVDGLDRLAGVATSKSLTLGDATRLAIAAIEAEAASLDGLDVERLARAILVAAKEEGRRPITDGFEWYDSAEDMAADRWITLPEVGPTYTSCGWIGTCGRPVGHRGQHGGFRQWPPSEKERQRDA
jgi:hypothetical protein